MDMYEDSNSDDSNVDTNSDDELSISSQEPVFVPRSSFQPCTVLRQALSIVDPLAPCAHQGKALYIDATNTVGQLLVTGCQSCMQL